MLIIMNGPFVRDHSFNKLLLKMLIIMNGPFVRDHSFNKLL
jgi:hypothetical protein